VTSDNTMGISTHLHYNCSTQGSGIRASSSGGISVVYCIMRNDKELMRRYTTLLIPNQTQTHISVA